MPDPSDDLTRRLRAEADRLDAAAPPITATDARSSSPAPRSHRRWLPAAAAVLVVAAIGAAWLLLSGDEDPEQLIVPADPLPTTTTTFPWSDFMDAPMGIAITSGDGVRVLDLDGTELGTLPPPDDTIDGPELLLAEPPTAVEPIDPAQVPDGCTSAFGGGGVRVALCGGDPAGPIEIDVVDSSGARRPLYEDFPLDPGGTLGITGHWLWALPSPDGQWVLAQWQADCGDPVAVLIAVDDGRGVAVDAVSASASRALGWSPEGRAVVQLLEGSCTRTSPRLGVHLRDPSTSLDGALELIAPIEDPTERAYTWQPPVAMSPIGRLLTRAERELDLEYVVGGPNDDMPVARFEGHQIGINGTTEDAPQGPFIGTFPLLHGAATFSQAPPTTWPDGPFAYLSFSCGETEWWLDWWDEGQPEVDSMLLLAEALVPHLYCTLPPR
jgi:hypothetical protein